ncbi:hypothetical protein M1N10_03580 [Thermodesulfovibrionales bacterium]|nr:hypothetical protein [Thermodesulfovibrionales bacterium]
MKQDKNSYDTYSVKEFLENKLSGLIGKMPNVENPGLHKTVISEVEKALFSIVLKETDGNCVKAAKILGINRNTLNKRMKEYFKDYPASNKRKGEQFRQ